MFTKEKCRQQQLVKINQFHRATLEWESDEFFPKKYKNNHNCEVTVLMIQSELGGNLFDKILHAMSHLLEFKITTTLARTVDEYTNALDQRLYDFFKIQLVTLDEDFVQIIMGSEKGEYIIPRGWPLNQLQKLSSPFDTATWILIASTLVTVFVGIQITRFTSNRVRNLFVGCEIGSPTMNMLNTFLCGCQTKLPKKTMARLLFLLFLLWSMIIRTCFQSLSYRALQLDNRYASMATYKDLRENNFSQFTGHLPSAVPQDVLENVFYK